MAPRALFLSSILLAACQAPNDPNALAADPDGATGSESAESEGTPTDSGTAESADTDDPTDPTSDPVADTDVPARAIQISRVEANSGVAVAIADGGKPVPGTGRNAPLPKNRNTAVRVYVDVDEASWIPRPILARLTVTQRDGRTRVYEETADINADSSPTTLDSNVLLGIGAEDIQPGAQFQVELFEASDLGNSLAAASEAPKAVDTGPAPIGIENAPLNMRVVLVPVAYDYGSCNQTVELSDEVLKDYEDGMYQQNPIESLEITAHEPIVVNDLDLTSSQGFYSLLNRAMELRAAEGPAPEVYYYVLFDNCRSCIRSGDGCLLGVAPGTPGPTQSEASQRVAIGSRYLGNKEIGVGTFVHEVGHSQGRAHVACPGVSAAGPDFSYPYENGTIGVWGFGVRDFLVRNSSNHKDYMSYCDPTWVSDWQWTATYQRIKTLSAWESSSIAPPTGEVMLVGNVNTETDESSWWTERGRVDTGDISSDSELAVVGPAGQLHASSADVDPWSEGPWVTVRAQLPATDVVAAASSFELRSPVMGTRRVPKARVRFNLAASMAAAPR